MSRKKRVLSAPAAEVLQRFVQEPTEEFYGFQIIRETGIKSGTLYPALRALAEEREFLIWRWEDVDPTLEERPPRRLYRLNGHSAGKAKEALAERDEYELRLNRRLSARVAPI